MAMAKAVADMSLEEAQAAVKNRDEQLAKAKRMMVALNNKFKAKFANLEAKAAAELAESKAAAAGQDSSAVQHELDDARERLAHTQQTVADLQQTCDELRAAAREGAGSDEATVAELREAVEQRDAIIQTAKEKYQAMGQKAQTVIAERNEQIESLSSQLQDANVKLEALQSQADESQQALLDERRALDDLKAQLDTALRDGQASRQELEQQLLAANTAIEGLAAGGEAHGRMAEELERTQEERDALQQQFQEMSNAATEREQILRQDAEDLRAQLVVAQAKALEAEAESGAKAELRKLEEDRRLLSEELNAACAKLADAEDALQAMQAEAADKAAHAASEVATYQERVECMQHEVQQLTTEMEVMTQERREAQKHLADVVAEKEAEIAALADRLGASAATTSVGDDKIEELESEISKLKDQVVLLEGKVSKATIELEEEHSMAEEAREEISQMLDELNAAKRLCNEKDTLLAGAARQLEDLRAAQTGAAEVRVLPESKVGEEVEEGDDGWGDDGWGDDDDVMEEDDKTKLTESQNTMSSAAEVSSKDALSQNVSSGASDLGSSGEQLAGCDAKRAATQETATASSEALQAAEKLNTELLARIAELEEEVQKANDTFIDAEWDSQARGLVPGAGKPVKSKRAQIGEDGAHRMMLRISELEEEAQKAQASFEINWEALCTAQTRVRELEGDVERLDHEAVEAKSHLNATRARVQQLEVENQGLHGAQVDAGDRSEQLVVIQEALTTAQEELEKQSRRVVELEACEKDLVSVKNELHSTTTDLQDKLSSSSKRIEEMEAEMRRLQEHVDTASSMELAMQELQAQCDTFKADLEGTRAELTAARGKAEEASSHELALQELQAASDGYKSDLEASMRRVAELEEETKGLTEAVNNSRRELEVSTQQVTVLEGKLSGSSASLEELQQLQAAAADSEERLQAGACRIVELEATLRDEQEKLAALAREGEGHLQKIAAYEMQMMKQSEQLAGMHALQEELDEIKAGGAAAGEETQDLAERLRVCEQSLSSEQKAVNRAAEEKMALMEMMNKLNEDVAAKDELVDQLKQQIAAGGGGAGSDSDKDKKIEELEAKLKKVMVDAKRVIEKYKTQEDEARKSFDALNQELTAVKAAAGERDVTAASEGEGCAPEEASEKLKAATAKLEELEMTVAQLKMNLAGATEEAEAAKIKLEKFKAAAAEKVKQDRAKYLQHLQGIKDGTASEEPIRETPIEAEDDPDDDIELPQAVSQVASAAASFVKGFW